MIVGHGRAISWRGSRPMTRAEMRLGQPIHRQAHGEQILAGMGGTSHDDIVRAFERGVRELEARGPRPSVRRPALPIGWHSAMRGAAL
jgi:hypothetical protein